MTAIFSDTQKRRLRELGVSIAETELLFENNETRDRKYQSFERHLVKKERERLDEYIEKSRRPKICTLEEKLAKRLAAEGFIQVSTPVIMKSASLAKMGIDEVHPLFSQVFRIDEKRCMRPMLAPHLYEIARELLRLREEPVRLFEIGLCFRKESQGAKHASEFTMLNLAEFGLPDTERKQRIEQLTAIVMNCVGNADYAYEVEESEVYGDTVDIVDRATGMELGSSAMGPHPLDRNWRINSTWVGIGFGLERLIMATDKRANMGRLARSLTYLDGIRLNI